MKVPTIISEIPLDDMRSRRIAVVRMERGSYEVVEIRRFSMMGGHDGVSRDTAIKDMQWWADRQKAKR